VVLESFRHIFIQPEAVFIHNFIFLQLYICPNRGQITNTPRAGPSRRAPTGGRTPALFVRPRLYLGRLYSHMVALALTGAPLGRDVKNLANRSGLF
jgi:hypothetical protein